MKILKGLGILVLIALVGLGIYFSLRGKSGTPKNNTGADTVSGRLPFIENANRGSASGQSTEETIGEANPRFGVLVSEPAIGYAIKDDLSLISVNARGDIFETKAGRTSRLTEGNGTANSIKLDPTGEFLAAMRGDASSTLFIYSLDKNLWQNTTLSADSFSWSKDGKTITASIPEAGESSIVLIDAATGKRTSVFAKLAIEDAVVSWAGSSTVALSTRPNGYTKTIALLIEKNGKTTVIDSATNGLSLSWSIEGTSGILSKGGYGLGETVFISMREGVKSTLPIKTMPDKCVVEEIDQSSSVPNTIICAVPNEEDFQGALMPDDYLQGTVESKDRLVRVYPKAGTITEILGADRADIDATDLMIKEGLLAFRNRIDGKIYGFRL